MKKRLKEDVLPYFICMLPAAIGAVFINGGWRIVLLLLVLVLFFAMLYTFVKIYREFAPSREEENAEDAAWFAEHQNPALEKRLYRIGAALSVFSIVLIPGTMLLWDRMLPWGVLCLLCIVISVFLAIRYPGYFSLIEGEKERRERCGVSAFSLILPFWIPVTVAGISFLMRYGIGSWKKLLLVSAIAAMVIGVALWLILPELRRKRQNMVAALCLAVLIGPGAVLTMNYVLDHKQPEVRTAMVSEKWMGTGKSGPSVLVIFSDGSAFQIPVSASQLSDYAIGDPIRVECSRGGFGIAYFYIP